MLFWTTERDSSFVLREFGWRKPDGLHLIQVVPAGSFLPYYQYNNTPLYPNHSYYLLPIIVFISTILFTPFSHPFLWDSLNVFLLKYKIIFFATAPEQKNVSNWRIYFFCNFTISDHFIFFTRSVMHRISKIIFIGIFRLIFEHSD